MRLLVDACVDVRVAVWLRTLGHDVCHLREEGLQRLPDGRVFDKAIAENRVVLTFDLDFAEIVAFSRGRNVGVSPRAPGRGSSGMRVGAGSSRGRDRR